MRYLKFLLLVIVVLFLVIVIVQNINAFSTKIHFRLDLIGMHYQSEEISLAYVAVVTFLFGVIITVFYALFDRFKLQKKIKDLYRIIRDKDKELNSLRNLPITSDSVVSGNMDGIIK